MKLTIDHASAEPPFEQLRRQISAGATDGTFAVGHKLATVRALAEELDLAPNTVAKAYRALESDGIIETHGRKGTFIASRVPGDAAAAAFTRSATADGLSLDQALRLVKNHWPR